MAKFKVGDQVIGNALANQKYSITTEGTIWTVGNVGTQYIQIVGDQGEDYWVSPECFDLLVRPIIIRRIGNKVIVENAVTGAKAEAKCSPEDEFDFYVGAQIAFRRLLTDRRVLPQDRLEELCRGSIHVGDKVRVIEGASFSEGLNKVLKLCKGRPDWMMRFAYRVPFKVDGKTYKVLAMDDEVVYITKACCEDRGACWLIRKNAVVKEV